MADMFQHEFLTGNPLLTLDDEFLRNHKKMLLRSDATDRVWKVCLDGNRLANGWKEFTSFHSFQDDDILVFRHNGDENLHVSLKKNKKPIMDSSSGSGQSCFVTACVTLYSLRRDRLDFSSAVSFGEGTKPRELDLVNEHGRRWTVRLAKNKLSGVFYIRNGWKNFCFTNDLSKGDLCKFKLFENREKPVLLLCPKESGNGREEEEEEENFPRTDVVIGGCSKENRKKKKSPSAFMTFKFTPSRYKNGQLYISSEFTRENGITKSGEITLLNKDGRKWSSYLKVAGRRGGGNEWFYMRRGWREMCEANGVKVNDSFKLELIWEDANPVFKFCSKVTDQEERNQGTVKKRACETPLQKTVNKRASQRPENQANRTNPRSTNLQRTQPKSCISDQVNKVKRAVVDTLNSVKMLRLELKAREENLEASLLVIDALGEKISGIVNTLV